MASPSILTFSEDTVTLAASGVVSGVISRHYINGRQLLYYFTYRLSGEAAPSAAQMRAEMVRMFQDHPEQEVISAQAPIDVYVYAALLDGVSEQATLIIAV